MSRKFRQATSTLTWTGVIVISALAFFQPLLWSTAAQTQACPGNLITNGNFTSGLVGGQLGSSGAVSNWSKAYGTPDVGTTVGFADAGVIGMWGNMNSTIGEGLQQNLGANALVQGRTYVISFYGRAIIGSDKQNYAHFRVRASASSKINWGVTDTVGRTTTPVLGAWTPISFTFTAAGNYPWLTVNVENDLSDNDGAKTSYGQVDNFCLREVPPDFKPTKGCAGKPVSFTGSAATSWNWNFGDGTPSISQQSPNHTFANPGTYNVTLCVNGTTNCVTKPVVISAAPPVPVITGPATSCGNLTATYSVPAVPGLSYSWTAVNGTINGSSTLNSVSVTWNPNSTGVISVTVTNKAGCSSTVRKEVIGCNIPQGECCIDFKAKADLKSLIYNGSGNYDLTATLSVNQSNVTRVVANVISTSLNYSSPACGTAGPVNGYVLGAGNVPGFATWIPVANGHEVIWHGFRSNVSGIDFPIQLKLPPPPTSPKCRDYLTICVKYTITYGNCKSCEVIRCYGPFKRGGPIKLPSDLKEIIDAKMLEDTP